MIIIEKEKYRQEEKILIECDFKSSLKCKGQYLKVYKNIIKCRLNNDGKDRCCYCFNTLTKTGSDNYNFKFVKNEKFFENIDTELKAYLLGFIAGDGCIKKDGLFLENHIDDIEILELFKQNISPQSEFHKHSDPERGKNTICLKIHSVKIVNDLLKHLKLESYGKKSDKIQFPDLSKKLLWHFIRGLFDSDGSIISPLAKSTYPRSNICSTSLKMQKDIIDLCINNNIKCGLSSTNSSVYFMGNNCLLFLGKIYDEASFFLKRKMDLYKIWKTWVSGKGTIVKPRKIRTDYKPITEEHKEKIREANRKRKGCKYTKEKENVNTLLHH
jgi:hypothetical protein